MSRSFLSLCVAVSAAFYGVSTAPSSSDQRLGRYARPMGVVSLNLETGELNRGPQVSSPSIATGTDLPDLDLGGYIGVDTGGGSHE